MLASEQPSRTTPGLIKIEVRIDNLWAAEPPALRESLTGGPNSAISQLKPRGYGRAVTLSTS